ncbi:MAG: hypothetical protein C7K11_08275 [Candidatus Amulumruptor caecigallinarius]|nr:MAG: hypothetical protein C7K11_08275 [Candidatus Amulumruptor caecigallinarius]
MSQIRDKKAYRKGIETKNPINAKSVQLIELHAFACDFVCLYLSESLDAVQSKIRSIVIVAAGNPCRKEEGEEYEYAVFNRFHFCHMF